MGGEAGRASESQPLPVLFSEAVAVRLVQSFLLAGSGANRSRAAKGAKEGMASGLRGERTS